MGLFGGPKKNKVDEVLFVDDVCSDNYGMVHIYTFKLPLNEARSVSEFKVALQQLHESLKQKWLALNSIEGTVLHGAIYPEEEREQKSKLYKEIEDLEKKQAEFTKTYNGLIHGKENHLKLSGSEYQKLVKASGTPSMYHEILKTDFTSLKN